MTIAEKLIQIAENEQKVYQAGYNVGYDIGYEEGTAIGNEQFAIDLIQGTASGEIRVPNGVTTIRKYLFEGAKITTIYLPNTLKSLQYYCFADANVDNIVFEEGTKLDFIYTWAFNSCKIDTLKLPDIELVEEQSLEGIAANKIIFGKYTGSIGERACRPDIPCEYDFSQSTNIPTVADSTSFDTDTIKSIIVPGHLYNEWVNRADWAPYKSYIVSSSGKSAPNEDNFTVYVDANSLRTILALTGSKNGIGKYQLLNDGDVPYLRIYGDGSSSEAAMGISGIGSFISGETGKYLVFAYRIPTTNTETAHNLQVFATTQGQGITSAGDDMFYITGEKDDRWHVGVFDIELAIKTNPWSVTNGGTTKFQPEADGSYKITTLRLDWFNQITSTESYIDVAYVGLCDSLDKALTADADYEGKEFKSDYFTRTMSDYVTQSSYNGMDYVTISTTMTGAEFNQYLYQGGNTTNKEAVVCGSGKYIGILYRNATGKAGQVHINSTKNLTAQPWYSEANQQYDTTPGWHFMILSVPNLADTICRTFRYDIFNGFAAGDQASIDIAFVKFFNSTEEAQSYYQKYQTQYNL